MPFLRDLHVWFPCPRGAGKREDDRDCGFVFGAGDRKLQAQRTSHGAETASRRISAREPRDTRWPNCMEESDLEGTSVPPLFRIRQRAVHDAQSPTRAWVHNERIPFAFSNRWGLHGATGFIPLLRGVPFLLHLFQYARAPATIAAPRAGSFLPNESRTRTHGHDDTGDHGHHEDLLHLSSPPFSHFITSRQRTLVTWQCLAARHLLIRYDTAMVRADGQY